MRHLGADSGEQICFENILLWISQFQKMSVEFNTLHQGHCMGCWTPASWTMLQSHEDHPNISFSGGNRWNGFRNANLQPVIIYEANLEGQPSNTSIIRILPREGKMGVKELWLDDRGQGEFGLSDRKLSPTVPFSVISPWALEDARMDLRERGKGEVDQYVEENDSD